MSCRRERKCDTGAEEGGAKRGGRREGDPQLREVATGPQRKLVSRYGEGCTRSRETGKCSVKEARQMGKRGKVNQRKVERNMCFALSVA
jgi:hypothetical protein